MSWTTDYQCDRCGHVKTCEEIERDSFLCECKGGYHATSVPNTDRLFHPEWDTEMRTYVDSYSKQEKLADRVGACITPRESRERLAYIRKYKEDYNREVLKKDGRDCKPGTKWSDAHGEPIRNDGGAVIHRYRKG